MSKIQVLPKEVSELIAAGEVAERPASVVKELVENSIDAGSTQITVEIKNGGVTFIRVADNGCGIARDDVATAFLRHATSKVGSKDDLYAIATLGFRGEALAAISSVSRVQMLTKQKTDAAGTLYMAEGAAGISVKDAGCPDGTTIIVRDLFFNTPARMKFLKKDAAEGTAVGAVLDHMALSHPEISFRFIRDGKNVFITPGDGKLESAVYAVCGREFASSLIPVDGELGGIRVSGYVCIPSACRPKRNAQFLFLNGRYVRSGTVSQALETAYKNSAMTGRYPACVLHLTVPYGAVDINVHPAKTEVRFSDERRIFDCVLFSVRNALTGHDRRPEMELAKNKGQIRMTADQYRQTVLPGMKDKSGDPLAAYAKMIENSVGASGSAVLRENGVGPGYKISFPARPSGGWATAADTVGEPRVTAAGIKTEAYGERPVLGGETARRETDGGITNAAPDFGAADVNIKAAVSPAAEKHGEYEAAKTANDGAVSKTKKSLPDAGDPAKEGPDEYIEYVGEAFATYIIVRRGDSLFLIDKHAAHERMIFNRLKAGERQVPQLLLSPEQVTLNGEDYTAVTENLELLYKAGFEIEDYGDGTVLVRAVPAALAGDAAAPAVYEVAANLESGKTAEVGRLDRIYETVACRAAVKAGNLSSREELTALAQAVLEPNGLMYCPHGRPVAIELKKREIEKQFGRIQ